jgi:predicted transcriptional regulator
MQHASDISRMVASYLRITGDSQEDLALKAGVSQSAVSRALDGPAERNGKARGKLFVFMQQALVGHAPPSAVAALNDVWDGSEEHADALASLISASGELWPQLKGVQGT